MTTGPHWLHVGDQGRAREEGNGKDQVHSLRMLVGHLLDMTEVWVGQVHGQFGCLPNCFDGRVVARCTALGMV